MAFTNLSFSFWCKCELIGSFVLILTALESKPLILADIDRSLRDVTNSQDVQVDVRFPSSTGRDQLAERKRT